MPALLLELAQPTPNWIDALAVALTRPPGVPERRQSREEALDAAPRARPRRISDDLAWLRQAIDEPAGHGLRALSGTAAVAAWEAEDDEELGGRLRRLRDRRILDAAGFLLHEAQGVELP